MQTVPWAKVMLANGERDLFHSPDIRNINLCGFAATAALSALRLSHH